jgi:hypothetical protein
MKLDDLTIEYLKGNKFSNSHTIHYVYKEAIPDRVKFLSDLAKGKNVLHLGCLDHQPLIEAKLKRNQWLHKELSEAAHECLGVDIDKEALDYVQSTFGFKNIILGDFTKEKLTEITSRQWDYAILGELLEHIDNPVEYLQAISTNYADCIKQIVITVPNAWTQTTITKALSSSEIINTDHRYWFTPYTLSKVMTRANMQVKEIFFANRVPLTYPQLVQKKFLALLGQAPKYNFTFASSIVAIATLHEK